MAFAGKNIQKAQANITLAAEAGRDVQVVSLFIGSLGGPDSGATSYEEMMMTNADRIAQALAR